MHELTSRRLRLRLARRISEDVSPRQSLYRGWFPVISSLCCSNFVYFYTFNTLKRLNISGPARSRLGKDLLMGIVAGDLTARTLPDVDGERSSKHLVAPAGAVNVILTTPMWVVNTRLKLQGAKFRDEDVQQTHYRGILGVCLCRTRPPGRTAAVVRHGGRASEY